MTTYKLFLSFIIMAVVCAIVIVPERNVAAKNSGSGSYTMPVMSSNNPAHVETFVPDPPKEANKKTTKKASKKVVKKAAKKMSKKVVKKASKKKVTKVSKKETKQPKKKIVKKTVKKKTKK